MQFFPCTYVFCFPLMSDGDTLLESLCLNVVICTLPTSLQCVAVQIFYPDVRDSWSFSQGYFLTFGWCVPGLIKTIEASQIPIPKPDNKRQDFTLKQLCKVATTGQNVQKCLPNWSKTWIGSHCVSTTRTYTHTHTHIHAVF